MVLAGLVDTEDEEPIEMEDSQRADLADMKYESARLATFNNWSLPFIRWAFQNY